MSKKQITAQHGHFDWAFPEYVRLMLREGEQQRAAEAAAKTWRHSQRAATWRDIQAADPKVLASWSRPVAAAARAGKLPRPRTGSASDGKGQRRRLGQMRELFGPLALLTLRLPQFDSLPLREQKTVNRCKAATMKRLELLGVADYSAAVERGREGGTHSHIVCPVAQLPLELVGLLAAARSGKGGGCDLEADLHGVLIGDSAEDLAAVAGYISKDPDGRFGLSLEENAGEVIAAFGDLIRQRQRGRVVFKFDSGPLSAPVSYKSGRSQNPVHHSMNPERVERSEAPSINECPSSRNSIQAPCLHSRATLVTNLARVAP